MALSQARLRELLHYDPKTGRFTWRADRCGGFIPRGAVVGWIDKSTGGRRRITLDRVTYHASRLAVLWVTGRLPSKNVDHINGNCGDNRWINLREATQSQNLGNSRATRGRALPKGVHWDKQNNRYLAQITVKRRNIFLGRFPTARAAHVAYMAAARKYFGEFARAR